jgi:hypothetical protein
VDYSESLQQKILGPNGTARFFSNCFKIADAATKLFGSPFGLQLLLFLE